MPHGSIPINLVLILILIIISAFFASAEIAITAANKKHIEGLAEKGDKRAKKIVEITENQTNFIHSIQIAMTTYALLTAGIVTKALSSNFATLIGSMHLPHSKTISFILMMIFLSFIVIVFGELYPKRIALNNPEKIALRSIRIVNIFSKILKPFVFLITLTTTLLLKITGQYSENVEEKISEEELKSYLQVGQQQGVINKSGQEMIVNIMDFDDKLAYEIMTPRTSLYMIDYDEFNIDKVNEMLSEGHSRAPVYKENADDIIGTIYIKDVFVECSKNGNENININNILKEPYFVPETKNVDQLLMDLKASKNYMAILIDEYGGLSGIVTIEDIVEEIVGDIEDEYDTPDNNITEINKNTYIIDASMYIDDVNKKLNLSIHSDNNETISGLIIDKLGFIPDENSKENFEIDIYKNIKLITLGTKDKRIHKVKLIISEEEQE